MRIRNPVSEESRGAIAHSVGLDAAGAEGRRELGVDLSVMVEYCMRDVWFHWGNMWECLLIRLEADVKLDAHRPVALDASRDLELVRCPSLWLHQYPVIGMYQLLQPMECDDILYHVSSDQRIIQLSTDLQMVQKLHHSFSPLIHPSLGYHYPLQTSRYH